jgi:uncharacterized protein Yka (UPF0111/DUF47 family)
MDPQFQELAKEIADALEERLTTSLEKRLSGAFEERIKTHIDNFEGRAETRMKMHFENLEEKVKMAAEGYGATLDGIERELTDLNKKVDKQVGDYDLVLTDHSKRIVKLEERR